MFLPDSGKTCILANLPKRRHFHSLDTVNNVPILCGGGRGAERTSCIQFNLTSGVWTNYATTLHSRFAHTSWVSSAGLVLMGGDSGTTTEIVPSGGERFSLEQNTW